MFVCELCFFCQSNSQPLNSQGNKKIGLVGLARDPTCRIFLWLNVLGSNICGGACYGKNAHSVGGADWREEMASALVQ